ncbi:MAG TPA: molybdopterin dinucleotide binding domain-containing protein, partial [Thermopolyspora sp.]
QAVLSTWPLLLDLGTLQAGEPFLAGTAHVGAVRLSAATAAEIGAADGDKVTVATAAGELTLPLTITAMPDRVVWVPTNSVGSQVRPTLGVDTGALVTISTGSAA